MQAIRIACCLFATVAAVAMSMVGAVQAAPVQVEPAFGYRIGDSIVAAGRIAVDARAELDPESLPRIGRINGWLELSEVRMTAGAGYREVVRVFLVTASDINPKLLFLPKAELKFRLDGREITEQLESVPVSVSPLTGAEPISRVGFGELRPDRDVPVPDAARAARDATWLAALLAALAALWMGLRLLAMRRPGFAPFGQAARRLKRLGRGNQAGRTSAASGIGATGNPPEDRLRAALRIMHEAFNQTSGEALFASQVDRFLSRHPRLSGESAAIHDFFRRSDAVFFGAAPDTAADLAWLSALARRLARLEERGK